MRPRGFLGFRVLEVLLSLLKKHRNFFLCCFFYELLLKICSWWTSHRFRILLLEFCFIILQSQFWCQMWMGFWFLNRRYKPLVKELRVWPQLNLDAPPGFSPFDEPVSMRTRSRSSSKSPRKGAKRLADKKSTACAERKGYCELCDTRYIGLQNHVKSRRHKLVAGHKDTYAELDRLIARGKTLKEFKDERIRKRSSEAQIQTRWEECLTIFKIKILTIRC